MVPRGRTLSDDESKLMRVLHQSIVCVCRNLMRRARLTATVSEEVHARESAPNHQARVKRPPKGAPMRIESVLLLALAIGACPLAAQYTHIPAMQGPFGAAGAQGGHTLVAVPRPAVNDCPVSMRAQHLSDGSMVKTSRPVHPAGIGQRLHLTLTNPDAKQIARAEVTIHGVTPKGRVMQASTAQENSADATRNMSVSFSAGPHGSASADLWAPGVSAVQSIELDSVTYSDGSIWKVADGVACRITPDPFMLITSR
jgi:hypothetical protein